jgi:hypothetical protein
MSPSPDGALTLKVTVSGDAFSTVAVTVPLLGLRLALKVVPTPLLVLINPPETLHFVMSGIPPKSTTSPMPIVSLVLSGFPAAVHSVRWVSVNFWFFRKVGVWDEDFVA